MDPSSPAHEQPETRLDASRLGLLSSRQKECLRLVYQHYGAKRIGRALKISPNTVNRHLQDARALFGASRSMDIAILLARHEGGDRLTTDPIAIHELEPSRHDAPAMAAGLSATNARNRFYLNKLQRIALIAVIAFMAVALAGALLIGAEAINRFFWTHQVDISDPPYRK